MNLFEYATRERLRFPTTTGILNVEHLWQLPLSSDKVDTVTLDTVARDINRQLKEVTEESFVQTKQSEQQTKLTNMLDIVKHIIAVKLNEKAQRESAANRKAELNRLTELLAEKDAESLKSLSREEIAARIAELKG